LLVTIRIYRFSIPYNEACISHNIFTMFSHHLLLNWCVQSTFWSWCSAPIQLSQVFGWKSWLFDLLQTNVSVHVWKEMIIIMYLCEHPIRAVLHSHWKGPSLSTETKAKLEYSTSTVYFYFEFQSTSFIIVCFIVILNISVLGYCHDLVRVIGKFNNAFPVNVLTWSLSRVRISTTKILVKIFPSNSLLTLKCFRMYYWYGYRHNMYSLLITIHFIFN